MVVAYDTPISTINPKLQLFIIGRLTSMLWVCELPWEGIAILYWQAPDGPKQDSEPHKKVPKAFWWSPHGGAQWRYTTYKGRTETQDQGLDDLSGRQLGPFCPSHRKRSLWRLRWIRAIDWTWCAGNDCCSCRQYSKGMLPHSWHSKEVVEGLQKMLQSTDGWRQEFFFRIRMSWPRNNVVGRKKRHMLTVAKHKWLLNSAHQTGLSSCYAHWIA